MNKLVLLVEDTNNNTITTPIDILNQSYKNTGSYVEQWGLTEKHHMFNMCKNYIEFQKISEVKTLDPNKKYAYYVPLNLFFEMPPLNLFQIMNQNSYNFIKQNNITLLISFQLDMFDPCVTNHFINKFFDWQRYHMWCGLHTNKTIFFTGCKLADDFTGFLHHVMPNYRFLFSPLLFQWSKPSFINNRIDSRIIYENYLTNGNKKLYTHLNKSGRIHRYTLLHGLRAHNLLDDSITSNVANIGVNADQFKELIPSEYYVRARNGGSNSYQERLIRDMDSGEIPQLLLDVDQGGSHSYVNWNYDSSWFYNSCFDIVGETGSYYDKTDWIQFTILSEKIHKTMFNYKPFIINGGPHSLKLLREMGFETFPELFDESYDNEFNMIERQRMIVEQVARWANRKDEFMNIVRQIRHKLEHNHNHYVNLDVEKLTYDKLINNV